MALPKVRVAGTRSGGNPPVEEFTAGAAIASVGLWVRINADNKVDPGAAGDDSVLGISASTAAADGDAVLVVLATEDVIFSAESAAASGTYDDRGDFCDLAASSELDLTAGTDELFKIIGADPTEPAANQRFLVSVNPVNSQASQVVAGDTA
jgi:hypothetical protein